MGRGEPPAGAGQSALVRGREAADGPASGGAGRAASSGGAGEGRWTAVPLDQEVAEVDPEELQEFLSADVLGVRADPAFKERLRHKLWRIVISRTAASPDDGESS